MIYNDNFYLVARAGLGLLVVFFLCVCFFFGGGGEDSR